MPATDSDYEDVSGDSDSNFEPGDPSSVSKKGKGKAVAVTRTQLGSSQVPGASTSNAISAFKRPRGRPRKAANAVKENTIAPKRPRGRPPKNHAGTPTSTTHLNTLRSLSPANSPIGELQAASQPDSGDHAHIDDLHSVPHHLEATHISEQWQPPIPPPPALAGTRLPDIPVPGMPGVFTDRALSKLGLGILNECGVFYCTLCSFDIGLTNARSPTGEQIGFSLETVQTHVTSTHGDIILYRTHAISALFRDLNQYAVWKGCKSKTLPPIPSLVVPAFPFLPITYESFACENCKPPLPIFIYASKSTKSRHYADFHKFSGAKDPRVKAQRAVGAAQTLLSTANSIRYFEVDVSTLPQSVIEGVPSELADLKARVASVYINEVVQSIEEVEPVMGDAHGLTRESFFLNRQGWPARLAGYNPHDLVGLVLGHEALQGFEDIPRACRQLFAQQQQIIGTTSARVLRAWLDTDSQLSQYHKLFGVLQSPKTVKRYCRIFSQFVCLVLETTRRLDAPVNSGSDSNHYVAHLTSHQKAQGRELLELLSLDPELDDVVRLVQALAVSCFAPENPSEMTKNKFNDIVHVFVMLKSVISDGSFKPTKDMVGATTALQYLFRSVLLQEAETEAEIPGANREIVLDKFQQFLAIEHMTYPFGHVKAIRSQMGFDVARNKGIANFSWLDPTVKKIGIYKGKRFDVTKVQEMSRTVVQRTEDILLKDILFGIPLEEFGLAEPKYNELQDLLDCTTLGYSVWTDSSNRTLHNLRHSLAHTFIRHGKLHKYFWSEVLPGDKPCWKNGPRRLWLERLGDFSLNLMACCHIHGGQPRRGAELVQMRNHNVPGRSRNLRLWHDCFIYILGYSKTLAITGLDRTDVHALPPRINRMIYILNALIRPLAVQWVRELFDTNVDSAPHSDVSGTSTPHDERAPIPDANASNVTADAIHSGTDQPRATPDLEQPEHNESDPEHGTDHDTGLVIDDADDASDFDYIEDAEEDAEEGSADEEIADKEQSDQAVPTTGLAKPVLKPSEIQNEMTFARCGQMFTSEHLTQIMGRYTKEFLGTAWGIKGWRHICIAIQRAHLGFQLDSGSSETVDTFMDLQAGHSSKVAAAFYAIQEDDRTLSGSTTVANFVEASKRLHAWLDGEEFPVPPTRTEIIQSGVEALKIQVRELSTKLQSSQDEVADMRIKMAELLSNTTEVLALVKILADRPAS